MTHNTQPISGLYAVTPDTNDTVQLLLQAEAALKGGVRLLQYRNKIANKTLQYTQAKLLLTLCHRYDAKLIINDDINLCIELGADGVHLGATDGEIASARQILGADKIIGASCYNQLDLARSAQVAGASYAAFGACFVSSTKPNAPQAPLSLFTQAKNELTLPLVAIGGITLDNAQSVLDAGADAIAVINALFGAVDITNTARLYSQLYSQLHS